jgi:hypothetical protein
MRSLILALVLGLTALGTVAIPSAVEANSAGPCPQYSDGVAWHRGCWHHHYWHRGCYRYHRGC